MGLVGKLQAETLIKAPAHTFHEMFGRRPHHISNVSPEKIQKCHLHEGDWGISDSVIEWNYAMDGKNLTTKQIIQVDEENKSITFKIIGGDVLNDYKSLKAVLQSIPKDDATTWVHWTLEYEKLNKDIRPPFKELEFLVHLSEDIDDHLVQA